MSEDRGQCDIVGVADVEHEHSGRARGHEGHVADHGDRGRTGGRVLPDEARAARRTLAGRAVEAAAAGATALAVAALELGAERVVAANRAEAGAGAVGVAGATGVVVAVVTGLELGTDIAVAAGGTDARARAGGVAGAARVAEAVVTDLLAVQDAVAAEVELVARPAFGRRHRGVDGVVGDGRGAAGRQENHTGEPGARGRVGSHGHSS